MSAPSPWPDAALALSGELKRELEKNMTVTEILPYEPPVQVPTLFGTTDPNAIIKDATAKATALAKVVQDQKLASNISGRQYVRLEGWTLLGSMLGVFPVCVWTRKLDDGWEARVEARTLGGQLVGAAEAQCCRDENTWKHRSDYALRSMAQTRATSKALRLPLGFVMAMAGFEATPEEEIPEEERRPAPQAQQRPAQPPRATPNTRTARQAPPAPSSDAERPSDTNTDLTPVTHSAVAAAYKEVQAARGAEFIPIVRKGLAEIWPHAFTAQANRIGQLTEAEGLEVLEYLDNENPATEPAEEGAPALPL